MTETLFSSNRSPMKQYEIISTELVRGWVRALMEAFLNSSL